MDLETCLNSLLDAANIIQKREDISSCGNIISVLRYQDSSTTDVGCENSGAELKSTIRANHNILERNRRAQLRRRYSLLRDLLPRISGHQKASNVTILKEATKEIQELKEKDLSLTQEKLKLKEFKERLTEELQSLKKDINSQASLKFDRTETEKEEVLDDKRPGKAIVSCSSPSSKTYFVTQNTITADVAVNTDFPDDVYFSKGAQISLLHSSRDCYTEGLE